MPDITMCKGEGCPIREACYRYTAKPDKYLQSWFMKSPYDPEQKHCSHQMPPKKAVTQNSSVREMREEWDDKS